MDVTALKLVEDSIKETRRNYETFFNAIDELLFVLDEQGNIIHTNSTVNKRLGYTKQELIGNPVEMVHPPERCDEVHRIVSDMLNGLREFCPVPIMTKSGVQIPVETRVKRGIWDNKPVIFGLCKDISRIRLSEEKFSKLFYLNPSACGLSDLSDYKYVEVNEAFHKLLGYEKEEVIGKSAYELKILTYSTRKAILQKADSNGRVFNVEADLRAKNGELKHVLLFAENIYIQDRKFRFTVVQDMTESKHAAEIITNHNISFNKTE